MTVINAFLEMNVFNKNHVKKSTSILSRTYLLYENHIFKDAADKIPLPITYEHLPSIWMTENKIALFNNFVSVSQALY